MLLYAIIGACCLLLAVGLVSTIEAQVPIAAFVGRNGPFENGRALRAIRDVENWDGFSESRSGARGPYGIKEITWRQHTKAPFDMARYFTAADRMETEDVARSHAAWIRDAMESRRLPQSVCVFALIWKVGLKAYTKGLYGPADIGYAERVQNVYESQLAYQCWTFV